MPKRYDIIKFNDISDGIAKSQLELNKGNIIGSEALVSDDEGKALLLENLKTSKEWSGVVTDPYSLVYFPTFLSFEYSGCLYVVIHNLSDYKIQLWELNSIGTWSSVNADVGGVANELYGAFVVGNRILINADWDSLSGYFEYRYSDDDGASFSSLVDIVYNQAPVFLDGKYYTFYSFNGTNKIASTTDFQTFDELFSSTNDVFGIDQLIVFDNDIYLITSDKRFAKFDALNNKIVYLRNFGAGRIGAVISMLIFNNRICFLYTTKKAVYLYTFDGEFKSYLLERRTDLPTLQLFVAGGDYLYFSDADSNYKDIHIISKKFSLFKKAFTSALAVSYDEFFEASVFNDELFLFYFDTTNNKFIAQTIDPDNFQVSCFYELPDIADERMIPKSVIAYHTAIKDGGSIKFDFSFDHENDNRSYTLSHTNSTVGDTRTEFNFPVGSFYDRIGIKVTIYNDDNNVQSVNDVTLKFLYTVKGLDQ